MKETPLMSAKKAKSRAKLAERYYGKRDILKSWEMKPVTKYGEVAGDQYLADLTHRVRGHYNDLVYRGMDGFVEEK